MIDDARFSPIFNMLEERHVVVLGHQGEPRNAWLPLEKMTIEGDRKYFAEHPQYHMFAHPRVALIRAAACRPRPDARSAHPDLQFVGVHLASLEWDVDRIGDFLDRYPHASVDLAARLVHLKLQSSVDREKVRRFFIKYQDRILYGSDVARGKDQSDARFVEEIYTAWLADWRFLTGEAALHSPDFKAEFRGLALPRGVIDKIYSGNARRVFPAAWPTPSPP